jgi:hypothetical protein
MRIFIFFSFTLLQQLYFLIHIIHLRKIIIQDQRTLTTLILQKNAKLIIYVIILGRVSNQNGYGLTQIHQVKKQDLHADHAQRAITDQI